MSATLSRFYFGSDGDLCKIVHPSADEEVLDGRHDEVGKTGVNVDRSLYNGCLDDRAVFILLKPIIAGVKALVGDLLTQRIALIDAIAKFQTDKNTLDTRLDAWPTPTPAQQILINAAQAKVLSDLQDVQTVRDNIAAIKAQLS